MNKDAKIYVAGHRGLVGSALVRELENQGYHNLVTRTSRELNLTDQTATAEFFATEKPGYVFLAAARVGGIIANNTYRADFIYDNLMIQNNVIYQSWKHKVKKLLFLGSTCIYPRDCPQPMREDHLLTSPLEYTNEPYALAKIAGIKMTESFNIQYGTNFLSVMPTNLYGPNDNFDLEKSHVLPALIRKFYLGTLLAAGKQDEVIRDLGVADWAAAEKILERFGVSGGQIEIWGSGTPRREFLWSEDMAAACVHLMRTTDFSDLVATLPPEKQKSDIRNLHVNIGTGKEISIGDLAKLVKEVSGYPGKLFFNTDRPDGTPRKLTSVELLHKMGWRHKVELEEGVRRLYDWYLASTGSDSGK